MRRATLALAAASLAAAAVARPHPAALGLRDVRVAVDASRAVSAINRNLVGVGWKLGTGDGVDDLRPNLARADIAFQVAARPDGSFDWSFAEAWVSEARAAGAEPMLILDYMPPWLARTAGPNDPRDPTRLPPRDLAEWGRIVEAGVEHFAVRHGVRWFEVWNEPDWLGFWQDAPAAFLETARHTALAVRRVERRTGIDLRFGGPACLFPDVALCIAPWLAMMRSIGMRPEFVSWHYYGNYPFVGPDGREPSLPRELHLLLGRRNPAGGVYPFPIGIALVRAATRAALAGTGWPDPELVLDEWNVSAGGFDRRHDTHEGAAFDAGALIEFQRARLDRSAFFISKDAYLPIAGDDGEPIESGDWGLVSWRGERKPAWWTFWLWQRLGDREVATRGSSALDGFWAIAARDAPGGRVTVMLASSLTTGAHGHRVRLDLAGLAPAAYAVEIRRIDAAHPSAEHPAETAAVAGPAAALTVELPANAVAFVELRPA